MRLLADLEGWCAAEEVVGALDLDRRLLAAVTGVALSRGEMDRVAERAFTLERLMLARSGRTRRIEDGLAAHFALLCRADGTFVDEAGFKSPGPRAGLANTGIAEEARP